MTTLSEILILLENTEFVVITDYSDEGSKFDLCEVFAGPVLAVPQDIISKYGLFPVDKIRTSLDSKCEVEISIFNTDDFFKEKDREPEEENNDETE